MNRNVRHLEQKGLVLVAVLWVVMLLTTIVTTLGHTSLLDMKVCLVRTEETRCKWACRAGTETAIGVLNEDLRDSDCLTDLWSDNDTDFNDVALERCYFTVKVIDEAGKLNINTITRERLMNLEYMTDEIADAIIDWRDNDDTVSRSGAEAGYYESLPFAYTVRNGPLKTIRELLLVKGVTADLFFGEDTNLNGLLDYNERDGDESPPADDLDDELDEGWIAQLTCYSYDRNVDAAGNTRVNINEADEDRLTQSLGIKQSVAKWIVEQRPNNGYSSIADVINENSPEKPAAEEPSNRNRGRDSNEVQAEPLDMQTFYQIADKITISNEQQIPGRININTAPREVLAALFGDDDSAEQLAEDIIAHRDGLMYGMESIAELLDVESMNLSTFKQIANDITVRSDVFTIRCVATADRGNTTGTTVKTEAVVDRSSTPCRILYWHQGASF
jgi:general secretion pathway protein K